MESSTGSIMLLRLACGLAFQIFCVVAAPTVSPSLKLDSGTFTGKSDGVTQKFLGIPFAKPPCAITVYSRQP